MAIQEQQLIEIMVAYFGRPPLLWERQHYLQQTGATVNSVCEALSQSNESRQLYGPHFSAQQVNALYQRLFNRDAEPAGLLYWSQEISCGRLCPAMVSVALLLGAQGADKRISGWKMEMAKHWVQEFSKEDTQQVYNNSEACKKARAALAKVGDEDGFWTAVRHINTEIDQLLNQWKIEQRRDPHGDAKMEDLLAFHWRLIVPGVLDPRKFPDIPEAEKVRPMFASVEPQKFPELIRMAEPYRAALEEYLRDHNSARGNWYGLTVNALLLVPSAVRTQMQEWVNVVRYEQNGVTLFDYKQPRRLPDGHIQELTSGDLIHSVPPGARVDSSERELYKDLVSSPHAAKSLLTKQLENPQWVEIDYTNYKGKRSVRNVLPLRTYFGSTEYHPEAQHLLEALDMEKGEMRTFAMADIHRWGKPTLLRVGDTSFQKQEDLRVSAIDLMEATALVSSTQKHLNGTSNWGACMMAQLKLASSRNQR